MLSFFRDVFKVKTVHDANSELTVLAVLGLQHHNSEDVLNNKYLFSAPKITEFHYYRLYVTMKVELQLQKCIAKNVCKHLGCFHKIKRVFVYPACFCSYSRSGQISQQHP